MPTQDTNFDLQRAELEATAAALGLRIATRCKTCGHWLTSPASRAIHQGPRCRAQQEARQ
ncbi:hypothetical protein [Rhodococcus aetherivorans]|uniref:hypothetical protein n=1 Tax=Rhodococcus aetherivorans TaxID=191292 RepID=UPI00294A6999|nr:hypothetical protein [Rhodococcus aetherivorans]MDV6293302.1 hypothetical protein [Rhodococcus aetherivorans]